MNVWTRAGQSWNNGSVDDWRFSPSDDGWPEAESHGWLRLSTASQPPSPIAAAKQQQHHRNIESIFLRIEKANAIVGAYASHRLAIVDWSVTLTRHQGHHANATQMNPMPFDNLVPKHTWRGAIHVSATHRQPFVLHLLATSASVPRCGLLPITYS